MMMKENPYNCTIPGRLFVGYEQLRKELRNGFLNNNSFAVIGGRRCGKTSLLIQIEKDLESQQKLGPFFPFPRRLFLNDMGKVTPDLLFKKIYNLTFEGIKVAKWQSDDDEAYYNFLNHMDVAKSKIAEKYGEDWLVILLIDEIDSATDKLEDDTFFQNLRSLLMNSRYDRNYRIVAAGVKDLENLISSGSPLNNLRHKYLKILKTEDAEILVEKGFKNEYDMESLHNLFSLTGRHPFLLQGILEKLWDKKNLQNSNLEWDKKNLQNSATIFLKEHKCFERWQEEFGVTEQLIYNSIVSGAKHKNDIEKFIGSDFCHKIDDAITILGYHCVIDDSDPDEPKIAGTLFRDWYNKRIAIHNELQNESYIESEKENALIEENSEIIPTIGIVTALGKEYLAVKAMFDSGKERFIEGIGKCLLGRINSKEVGTHNLILAEAGMGNNIAALCAEKIRQAFSTVDTFVIVGIAGAVPYPEKPEHHVRLGDIVVCDEKGVIQYDLITKSEAIQHRNPPRAPKAGFLKAAKVLSREERENKFPWNDYIDEGIRIRGEEWKRPSSKYDDLFDHRSGGVIRHPVDINRRNNEPRIFLGAIASGNTLLKDPVTRDKIRDDLSVKAVEMEASGVADAAWINENINYFVVRGTCDYCDGKKNDIWQEYAAIISAAYTKALLASIPGNENPQDRYGQKTKETMPFDFDYLAQKLKLPDIRPFLKIVFDDTNLISFCQDYYFNEVYDKFSEGMQKTKKLNILLDHCSKTPNRVKSLLQALYKEYPSDFYDFFKDKEI